MRVAITGGTGYIGRAVAGVLRGHGHDVTAVRRGPSIDSSAMWDPAEGWVRPGAFEGFDAVVNVGGVSIAAKRWSAARKAQLRSSRIDSTRVLAEHLASMAQPPRVLVSASAVGIYGDRGEERLDEGAAPGTGFLATLVRDWEAATEAARARGIRVVLPRIGPIVARDSELMARLLLPFRLGLGGPIGSGRQQFSWVAIEDVARAFAFAVEQDGLSGPVNVTSPFPVTNAAFTRALGQALHRPAFLPLPAFALRLLFGAELANEVLLGGQAAYPDVLTAAGFRFDYPTIQEALAAHLGGRRVATEARR